jgi:TPR repeat protein
LFWLLRVSRAYWLAAAAVVAILAIATIYWLPRYAESVYQQALLFKLHSDYIDAARMMNRACGLGERRACTSLGLLYVGGHGASTDPKQAARLFQKSCDGGDFDGCTQLGSLYESGNGVPKNTKTAADLYRQGCDGGDAEGCTALGLLYDGGDGVPKDPKQAAAYFQRACDDDDSSGCNFLGVDYESGSDGLPKDAQKAFANYKKACDGGYIRACGSLSFLYQAGPETLQNQKLAVELGQKSCDADIENGCIVMGNYYHIHADTIDDTKAKIYYNKACSLGAETACKYVKGIK